MKDENPGMLLVHCVIHRENLVAKSLSPVLNKIINLVVKCINSIKASAKQGCILKLFCEENNEAHVRLLLHTEAYLSYLTDIFEKLNILNKKLQGTNKTLVDAKAKIFGFITSIELFEKDVHQKQFEKFHWLQKCEVTHTAKLNIVEHLTNLSADLKGRFSDLKEIDFLTWLMQPMLVNLSHISNMQYQEELAEMQNDESVKTLFNIKGSMAWFFEETEIKYPSTTESCLVRERERKFRARANESAEQRASRLKKQRERYVNVRTAETEEGEMKKKKKKKATWKYKPGAEKKAQKRQHEMKAAGETLDFSITIMSVNVSLEKLQVLRNSAGQNAILSTVKIATESQLEQKTFVEKKTRRKK
ncbi:zinc finger BED domain-containing protein 5-like [Hydra vulgaris]|uniref:Zinc finger BED domain-containing protein 5-like n=1 Tax=Hydra vulgaris TaxID=6087 RepID=A0ABM4CLW9_HYDVU